MLKSSLALFLYQQEVDEALRQLNEAGFLPKNLKTFSMIGNLRGGYQTATIGTHPDDRYADLKSELFKYLIGSGIPREEAFLFTEGVRQGEKLLIAISDEAKAGLVAEIFKQNGALDLTSRKMYASEMRLAPETGMSGSPFTNISQDSKYEDDLVTWTLAHRHELGPEVKVKAFALPSESEDKSLASNLNE